MGRIIQWPDGNTVTLKWVNMIQTPLDLPGNKWYSFMLQIEQRNDKVSVIVFSGIYPGVRFALHH